MKLSSILEALKGELIVKPDDFDTINFSHIIACDLMSDVLVVDEEDFILVTSLTSDQVARTADIVGAVGIVLVNGKKPQPNLKALAEDHEIPILSTPLDCYHTCITLGKLVGD